jgi:RNA polymerase sigma factor (sigma-70 family)
LSTRVAETKWMIEAAPPADAQTSVPKGPTRLSRLSDELLARYTARGSQRAFAVLYERYHQPLYGYCRSIVRDDTDAQDALQSTFAGALSALQRGRRNAPLRPWLFRIAHNEAVSLIRRRQRDSEHEHAGPDSATAPSAEDRAAERARWSQLTSDIAMLPERLRGALLLREMSGLAHEEIAVALGTTAAGAKQAIFEARQALVELAEGRAMECEDVRRRISDGDGRVLRGRRVRAHLRDCPACERFAAAIPARQAELRAFAPALPPAAAAAVLSHLSGAVSGHAASGAGSVSAASTVAGTGAAAKAAGTVIAWKTLAAGAVALVAAAGVAGLAHHAPRHSSVDHPRASASPSTAAAATRPRHGAGSVRTPGTARRVSAALPATRARRLRSSAAKRSAGPVKKGRAGRGTHGLRGRAGKGASGAASDGVGSAAAHGRARAPGSATGRRARSQAGAAARTHTPKRVSETRSRGKAGRSGTARPARRAASDSPTGSGALPPRRPRGKSGK